MNLLLDTHVLLWWLDETDRVATDALAAMKEPSNDLFVSAASVWEMSTKHRLGRLPLPAGFLEGFDDLLPRIGMSGLPVSLAQARVAGGWDTAHKDPFDRLLAAQARLEQMVLVTADPAFRQFGIPTLW